MLFFIRETFLGFFFWGGGGGGGGGVVDFGCGILDPQV